MKHFLLFAGLTLHSAPICAEDWPQWQGADRNAMSKETGLLKEWPEGGPTLAWKITAVGGGYSAPAVSGGRLYGMSKLGEDGEEEVIWARSEKDGMEIWVRKIAGTTEGGMRQGIEGAGCTPTVDGDHLYALGHGGDLVCLKAEDGAIVWQRNVIKDLGGRLPTWRFNESPLIDGDKIICTPGGVDATLVALNKLTGELIWKSKVPDEANVIAPPNETPKEEVPEPTEADVKPAVVVAAGATWKYSDTGASPGGDWTKLDFKEEAWKEGAAQLGYGDRDEATRLSDAADHYPTYYFRHAFEVRDPGSLKPLVLRLLRDDGAVVYLNGSEIVRDNMPEGAVVHGTFASSTTPSENGFYVHDLPADKLVAGTNILAVEVHQADAESSDVSFDLELREKVPGKDKVGPPPSDRRRRGGGGGGRRFGESGAAYSSAIGIDFEGQRQYVQFTSKTLVGVAASDGKVLWRYDKPSNKSGINCSTPIYQNGQIFAASAYGAGGGLARLMKDEQGDIKAEEIWFSGDMENHHGGMVVIDGYLYGANGGNGGG